MHQIMEFALPVFAASAEGMAWVLIIVILLIIGKGKILPSEKALVIERAGQYRMELAPGLNLAQPFIETVAKQLAHCDDAGSDGAMRCYEVKDKHIASRKQPYYLLNVSRQNGCMSFVARTAHPIDAASSAHAGPGLMDEIESAMHSAAASWGIELRRINLANS